MGYGKRLKEVLDERGMSVMEFSRRTEVSHKQFIQLLKEIPLYDLILHKLCKMC